MIVVGGFNTAVDRWLETDAIRVGGVSRVRRVRALPGGKGLHVAVTIAALGEGVRLVGLIDRRRRDWFTGFLKEHDVLFEGIEVPDDVRTCLAIQDDSGAITELLEPGPEAREEVREQLNEHFLDACRESELGVLCGSAPAGSPDTVYRDLIAQLSASGVRCLLDSSEDLLRLGVEARPFLVKPNRAEAEALCRTVVDTPAAAAQAAASIGARGIPFVVISLGADGAVASVDGRLWHAKPPAVAARNAVGAGDCLLGGLAVGLARGLEPLEALRLGVACGTAKVLSPETGLLRRPDFDAILPAVHADWLR